MFLLYGIILLPLQTSKNYSNETMQTGKITLEYNQIQNAMAVHPIFVKLFHSKPQKSASWRITEVLRIHHLVP